MNPRLAKFVARAHQAQRIGFGDLRRLQRDVLPSSFLNREEVEALLALDRHLERADEGWSPFLAAAVRRFVVERTAGASDPEAAGWLAGMLAEASPRMTLVVAREVVRDCPEADERLRSVARPARKRKAEEPAPDLMPLRTPEAARERLPRPGRWPTPAMPLRASWSLPDGPP